MSIDWTIAAAGAGVGFLVGLTGMGGGALMTPLLVLLFGISPAAAVSSDLVAAVVMKPIGGGVHLRHGTVDVGLVRWLVLGSVPAAFLSVWALHRLGNPLRVNEIVQYATGTTLLLAALAMSIKGAFSGRARESTADEPVAVRPLATVLIGVFGGIAVGLTSVGSGSLMMVLLMLVYPTLVASRLVGTDLVQAVPLVAAAAFAHILFGHVEFDVTTSLIIGSVPGVYLGARLSARSPDHLIRPILALVLVLSGLKMLRVPTVGVGVVGLLLAVATVMLMARDSRTLRRLVEGPTVSGET